MESHVTKLTIFKNKKMGCKGKILEFPSVSSRIKLMDKLTHEFEQSSKDLLLEDIKEFLMINEWKEATLKNLLEQEHLLYDLLIAFLEDDEFNELFEKKIKSLAEAKDGSVIAKG